MLINVNHQIIISSNFCHLANGCAPKLKRFNWFFVFFLSFSKISRFQIPTMIHSKMMMISNSTITMTNTRTFTCTTIQISPVMMLCSVKPKGGLWFVEVIMVVRRWLIVMEDTYVNVVNRIRRNDTWDIIRSGNAENYRRFIVRTVNIRPSGRTAWRAICNVVTIRLKNLF